MPVDPRATYRLQLHQGFTLEEAGALAPYLEALGISHLYLSPCLRATPGSTHGYDVVDHSCVNPELGGEEAHERLVATLREHQMGQLLDIVPNHMAIGTQANRWWWDVLENGPFSRFASYFDVEWDAPEERFRNRVLLPVLGDHYGRVLDSGELRLVREGGSFRIRYYEHQWPVSPSSLPELLLTAAEAAGSDDLSFAADALEGLSIATATDLATLRRRHRHKEVLRGQIGRLCEEKEEVAAAVDAEVARVNADPALLHALLEKQNYRLAFWRSAARDLGYRRFFDVNTLAGLRVETDRVFLDTHDRVLRWLDAGVVDGIRIDHPDGMREPVGYFSRLQAARTGLWMVVEKILVPGERLRPNWPVSGTTGYDFIHRAGGLFVDPAGEEPLTRLYQELTGESRPFEEVLLEKKRQVLKDVLGSDVNRLTQSLVQVCESRPRQRDYTRHQLHELVRELLACFPVYRTYANTATGEVGTEDIACVEEAVSQVRARRADVDPNLLDFVRDLLLLRERGPLEDELVSRFQQATGPAMAKGAEDTAFYCYNRLVSLNEVGGDPGLFGTSIADFHDACLEGARRWPLSLLASTTHDTKRSEDVRARISLLSEMPDAWASQVRRWFERHARYWEPGRRDASLEYLYYQTLVGIWPVAPDRLLSYMEKAAREAKASTSWLDPDTAFEAALRAFVSATLGDQEFTRELQELVRPLLEPARINSLALTLLKATCPGVPDFYQGTELWFEALVDPDNRRPVDYELRRALAVEVDGMMPEQAWARLDEGMPKLWLIRRALALRRRRRRPFGPEGTYLPLVPRGARETHVVAFVRGGEVVTVVPRLVLGVGRRWEDTAIDLPEGRWSSVLTGETIEGGEARLADLLARFPVALLEREA